MMNKTYKDFIQHILNTRGRFNCGDEYCERHHIIPKCMDGTNDEENLIDLFAQEHFEAHKLLALENPNNEKLQYAFWCMCSCKNYNGRRIYDVSAEDYALSRINHINIVKNRKVSEETRRKQSEALKGEKHPWYGKHHTEDTKKKISLSRQKYTGVNHPMYGKKFSDAHRKKLSENHADFSGERNPMYGVDRSGEKGTFYGKHHTEESKTKISQSRKGKRSGIDHPNYGKHRPEETRQKISESLVGLMSGEKHPRATPIVQLDMNDNVIRVWSYAKLASQELKISAGNISLCLTNQIKYAAGCHRKYLYDKQLKDGTAIPGAISLGLITEDEALKQLNNEE